MSMSAVLRAIRRHQRFLVTAHINPEADAVGSQLALASLLKRLNKRVIIINDDPLPDSCLFLPGIKSINSVEGAEARRLKSPFCAVALDSPVLKRIGSVRDLAKGAQTLINIDHHIKNKRYGDVNWVDVKAAAVGEMIYGMFCELKLKLTKAEAACLYAAILIDTGSFRHSNTTPKTHRIAAELIRCGLDTSALYENLFEMKSFQSMRLLGFSLSTMNKSRDGKVAWFWLTRRMLRRAGAKLDDSENFVNYARAIKGVKVAVFFKEADEEGAIQVSLRGKRRYGVDKAALKFGGGGHAGAAGCVIRSGAREAQKMVLKEVCKIVRNGRDTGRR